MLANRNRLTGDGRRASSEAQVVGYFISKGYLRQNGPTVAGFACQDISDALRGVHKLLLSSDARTVSRIEQTDYVLVGGR